MLGRGAFGAFLALSGCVHKAPPPPPPTPPHFTVGNPFQSQGEWRYPRDFDSYDQTGLASTIPDSYAGLNADNETYDPQAIAAASPVLQLPAIATVTNLANGYSMAVRIDDRGPDDPGRILAVTPRVARDLGFPASGVTEVEVVLQPQATAALDGALGQDLKLTAAPLAGITAQSLAPPGAAAVNGNVENLTPQDNTAPVAAAAALSGRVTAYPPTPGPLYVQIPGFGRERDARAMQRSLYGIPSEIVPIAGGDRVLYAVNAGPYATVQQADAALRQLLAQGVTDPQIIVR